MDEIKRCKCGWRGELFEDTSDFEIVITCNICDKKVKVKFKTMEDIRYAKMDAIDKWNKGEMV